MKDEEDFSIFQCDECGVEFGNIFEYLREHELDFKVLVPLGSISVDLIDMLKELYELTIQRDEDAVKNILSGMGAAFYAHANGFLDEMVDEILIEETVERATKNLDVELRKLLRKANDERRKD